MPKRKKRQRFYEFISVKAGPCRLRSKLELEYLTWLDNNPEAISVAYEKLWIVYTSNLRTRRTRRYYPDFVVCWKDGRQEIIEVKPARRVKQRTVQKKAAAATEWAETNGYSYRFVTEYDMRALGLLRPKKN